MSEIDHWRDALNGEQRPLLNELWEYFRTKHEWPTWWEFHNPHRKMAVRNALTPLFGSVVLDIKDHLSGGRYHLTLLGILLTEKGKDYERLLLGYLESLRRWYQAGKGRSIESSYLQTDLRLSDEETILLGQLITQGSLFSHGSTHSSNWSSPQWQAGIPEAVEEFSPTGSLDRELEILILDKKKNPEMSIVPVKPSETIQPMSTPRIFISHSSRDKELAEALVNLIRAAFPLGPNEIRCTSVDGYRIPTGVSTDSFLRTEVLKCDVLVALITEHSLNSDYVIFELGARWGVERPLFPILAKSVRPRDLPSPLNALNARLCDTRAEIFQLLHDLGAALNLSQHPPAGYDRLLEHLVKEATQNPSASLVERSSEPKPPTGTTQLSARDICVEIREAPPLQQKKIAEQYLNSLVDWEVLYSMASPCKEDESKVSLVLKPWVEEGFDTAIRCKVSLHKYPALPNLSKDSPMRVTGQIVSVDAWTIELQASGLFILNETERFGTRIHMVTPMIVSTIGNETAIRAGKTAIVETVKTQIALNKPAGLRLDERGIIVPEIPKGTKPFRLLVLFAAKQLVENYGKNSRDKLFSLENEIHQIESYD